MRFLNLLFLLGLTGLTVSLVSSPVFADEDAEESVAAEAAEGGDADHGDDGHGDAAHADAGHADAEHGDSGHGDAEHGDNGHGDAGHETGLPMNFKADLALWSLITFVLFVFVLRKLAWTPLIAGLDKRESGIRAAIAEAQENQRKSEALLAEYEGKLRDAEQTVAAMVAEAKRDAERTAQDIVAKAQADVDSMRTRATEEIGRAKDTALAEVFDSVNSRIALATEHVLGRAISGEDQERLVEEALAEIGS